MRDVNYQIRRAYYNALKLMLVDGVDIPVYAFQAPATEDTAGYIVFQVISNVDNSTANSSDVKTTVRINIYTYGGIGNTGRFSENIANEVYERIYNKTTSMLTLDNHQMVSTSLVNDIQSELSVKGSRVYIDRIITFVHNIFVKQ